MPLAMITMSGVASVHSVAKKRPVRRVAGLHFVDGEQDAVAVGDRRAAPGRKPSGGTT